MTNIASVLRSEITRVARREVRSEVEGLRKASAGYRTAIADLRRQLAELQKQVKSTAKLAHSVAPALQSASAAKAVQRRFSPTRLASHRAKVGLSAAAYGQLVGMSGATIFLWEQGKTRPNSDQVARLAAVRSLSKRELASKLMQND